MIRNPLKLPIKDDMRISSGFYDFKKWKPKFGSQGLLKPPGMWYSFGLAWIKFIVSEKYEKQPKYIDLLEVDKSKLICINTPLALDKFHLQYGISFKTHEKYKTIDWKAVMKDYGGIEIAPYIHQRRFSYLWYYGFDIASGCIWDADVLLSRTRLYNLRGKYYYKVKSR